MIRIMFCMCFGIYLTAAKHIMPSQLFIIPITPDHFNWSHSVRSDDIQYQASLVNFPDLPSWIHYTYSYRDHRGYLYGVAPKDQKDFELTIIALDKRTYDTRSRLLNVVVSQIENLPKYQVQLNIKNKTVEDIFDPNCTESLFDVFRNHLWKNATDLQLTSLLPAVELGARLPLKPGEQEGTVLRLGSSIPFSNELTNLKETLSPTLEKLTSCDFIKTNVERYFKEAGFVIDWCYFRLKDNEDNRRLHRESARRDSSASVIGLPSSGASEHSEWRWARPRKLEVPARSYRKEIATTIFVPAFLLLLLVGLLSASLCLHYENGSMEKRDHSSNISEACETNGVQMVQYATGGSRGTLRSLSAGPASPSPSELMNRSPRTTENSNPFIRPNPPPYISPNNFSGLRADF